MEALLSDDVYVKTLRGDVQVRDLISGDQVIGYNVAGRQLVFLAVALEPGFTVESVGLHIRHGHNVNLPSDTKIFCLDGNVRVGDAPPKAHVPCILNPTKLVSRDFDDFMEYGQRPATRVTWAGDYYLQAGGVLVSGA